jgi:hypothetical protein
VHKAWIDLYHGGETISITVHKHYLVEHDIFATGRWLDFKVIRVDGEIDLELSRRPDLEDSEWCTKTRDLDLSNVIKLKDRL